MHYRIFSSSPGLHSLGASCTLPVVTIKYISRHHQMFPGGQKVPLVESHWSRIKVAFNPAGTIEESGVF